MDFKKYCTDPVMMPSEHRANAEELFASLEPIEDLWIEEGGSPWVITSGYRFPDEHVRIYRELNAKRKAKKLQPVPVPASSHHLKGHAVDVADPDGKLKEFIKKNEGLFEFYDIYMEHFDWTLNFVHFQCVPPMSGLRYFVPYPIKQKQKK